MTSSKIIVKLPLNKQVLNNNHNDIHWSKEDDISLLKIIENSNISDFKITGLNIEELSTAYNVPINFLLKKFIQLHNEKKLKDSFTQRQQADAHQQESLVDNTRQKTQLQHDNIQTKFTPNVANNTVSPHSRVDPGSGKTEIINPNYSYYIDKNDYSPTHDTDEDEEEEEDNSLNLLKSSDFLLHRSRILPPRLDHSTIEDFFSDEDPSETDEVPVGYKLQNAAVNEVNNVTIKINNEDVNGIISNKKLNRKNSGASDLSNRSELERALLDQL